MICACCGNETFTLRSVGIMPDMCERCAMSAESVHAPAFTETSRPSADPLMCSICGVDVIDPHIHTRWHLSLGRFTQRPGTRHDDYCAFWLGQQCDRDCATSQHVRKDQSK